MCTFVVVSADSLSSVTDGGNVGDLDRERSGSWRRIVLNLDLAFFDGTV